MSPETVFITKYALSDGIKEVELLDTSHEGRMATVQFREAKNWDSGRAYFYGEGKDWHRTKDAAIARAEEMRTKKIASHNKSIAKLQKLDLTQVRDAR